MTTTLHRLAVMKHVALALVVSVLPAAAQQPAPDIAAFDAYVAQAARAWRIPGLAVAVVKDGKVVLAKGYGVRELGKPDVVDTGTRFAIGSTTKAMTAAALAMLVDEGKVAWDAPVITYLPDFRVADPYITRELTVRDLLTHRGGLGNADQLWASTDYTTDEIVRRVATIEPAYSLRSRFIYQNIMYAVAGEVIEAASGMSWAEFLRTRIFQPLGMNATAATLGELRGQPNVATPHVDRNDTIRTTVNRPVDAVAAAGSVWSSVDDMAKWMRFVLDSARVDGRRLISEPNFRALLAPTVIAPVDMYASLSLVRPRFFTYGLGWFLHDYFKEPVAMHTGSIDGMSALIGLLPEQRAGVYVLANLDHAELRHALMYRVFDLYSGRQPRDWSAELLAIAERARTQAAAAQRQQRRVPDTQPSVPLERYAGVYTHPTYGTVTVTLKEGALRFAFGRDRNGALSHWHYDTFQARWDDGRSPPTLIPFATDGAGNITSVRAFGITFPRGPQSR